MQIYIDESGNLGKDGRFFVIAALVLQNPKRIKNIIKKSCVKFGHKGNILDEIKACNLKFPQKQNILEKLNKKDDFSYSYIVADKKYLLPKILADKNVCYNYLTQYLFKPIIKGANEDIQVVLDNHTIKVASKNSLKDYIKTKAYTEWNFDKKITFQYENSKNYRALQAIDLITNTIYGRYTYDKHHLYKIIDRKLVYSIKFPIKNFNKQVPAIDTLP